MENKKSFICGGVSLDMAIYSLENYENLGVVKKCHNGYIRGISLLNGKKIISGSEDKISNIYKIK